MTIEKKMPTMGSSVKKEINDGKVTNSVAKEGEKNAGVKEEKGEEKKNVKAGGDSDLQQKIEELENKNAELERKLMYIASEYENSKRRNAKDLEDTRKFTISKFAEDVVSIFDVLQKAVETVDMKNTDKTLFEGVKMTISEFERVFEKMQITKIEPEVGSVFDHGKQEAISRVASELEVGAIVNVIRCGYELYGRLLRPAMVVVSGGK